MSWSIPLRLDAQGSFPSRRQDPVADAARLILGVAPGERRLEPEFGWRAHLLPDPGGPLWRQVAAALAEDDLRRWAGDLGVEKVEVLAVEGSRIELSLRRKGDLRRIEVRLRGRRG